MLGMITVKNLIRLEEIAFFILSIYLFNLLGYSWYWFIILLLLPDIGMIGYIIDTKVGALIYNIFHHRALFIIIYMLGNLIDNQV